MTSIRVLLRRRGRALSFLGATGLAIWGVAGAGSAQAGSTPAPPNYQYSSVVSAIGIQVALQRNPDFSSLPDPFDVETPDSEAQLNSFGTSAADGHIVNLNGFGGIPGLICLAAGPSNCAKIPVGQLTGGVVPFFPPPDPLDASATYPRVQSAQAPVIGAQAAQAAIDSGGFALDLGAANATAQQYATTTSSRAQNLIIPGGLTVGSSTTTTTQTATSDALTTTAISHLSNVAIGGTALTIGGITTSSTVVSRPGKPAQDTTSTVLSNVKSAGLNATVDASGIHINGNALPGNVVDAAQQFVNKSFGAAGIKISLAQVTHTDDTNGHSVAAYGLRLTYDHLQSGSKPITVPALPCPPQLQGLPGINPCTGVSFTIDGAYHGQVGLGQVGVVSLAQPSGFVGPPGCTTCGPSPSPQPTGAVGAQPPGGVGPPPPGPGVSQGPGPTGAPPTFPSSQRNVADQLTNVSDRLKWFFPLFALGVFALIGRLRIPARLPGPK